MRKEGPTELYKVEYTANTVYHQKVQHGKIHAPHRNSKIAKLLLEVLGAK